MSAAAAEAGEPSGKERPLGRSVGHPILDVRLQCTRGEGGGGRGGVELERDTLLTDGVRFIL